MTEASRPAAVNAGGWADGAAHAAGRSRRAWLVRALLLGAALAGAFVYGYFTHRSHWFPYRVLVALFADRDSGPRPGLWRYSTMLPRTGELTADQRDRLRALPYTQGYSAAGEASGVTLHDPARAQPGLTAYVSAHAPEAVLMDMDGDTVHRWRLAFRDAWPDREIRPHEQWRSEFWRRAHFYGNGDVLAIFENLGLVKLDARSRLQWSVARSIHHHVAVAPDGRIFALEARARRIPALNQNRDVQDDLIVELASDGRIVREFSVYDAFAKSPYVPMLLSGESHRGADPLHTNTIVLLDGTLAGHHPAFAAGRLLISLRNPDLIAIVDPAQETVAWAMRGMWSQQHDPVVVGPTRVAVFDNQGAAGRSRVLEFDPLTQLVTWEYRGTADQPLFSPVIGALQALANGNLLVTESTSGRAIEVARDGAVVWEFVNPFRTGEQQELIAALCDVRRLPPDTPYATWTTP